ncbi:hypothetical protein [Actinotalea subterranea]|uniref:hypothetical protein n=1 Tax=Actinotalea subterranea TaxID=2607497 RepID=UPI0011EFCDD1|nr:hypothetical protein [Actinotalea subterranea]
MAASTVVLGAEHRTPDRSRGAWAFVGPALLFHLLTRALTVTALVVGALRDGRSYAEVVTGWDGKWFGQIVAGGYPTELPVNEAGHVVTNPAAMFPLFPMLLRPLTALGIPYWLAAQVEVLACSTGAAVVIALVCRHYVGDRVAILVSCCWSVFPTASVLSVAYSEALFTLTAAGTLLLLLRRQWVWAGVVAALAGAARPTGIVVVAAVGVAVLEAIARRREWRSLVALAIAPLGTLGSLALIGLSAGRLDAWFITQSEGWRVRYDGGATFARWVWTTMTEASNPTKMVFAVAVLAAVALAVLAALRRPPLPVLTFLVLGTLLAIGQGGAFYLSPLRFMLPLFPLLVPVAAWLAGRPRWFIVASLGGAALVSAAIGVYYFTISGGAP